VLATGPAPTLDISFDSTGAAPEPVVVALARDGVAARVRIEGDGSVRVAR